MYLRDKTSGDLVEVIGIEALFDPCQSELEGRFHAGEELQEMDTFTKSTLIFPSGESLPKCWLDPDYQH